MTREDYCSFELSKLLKEKGFDFENQNEGVQQLLSLEHNDVYYTITHSLAMKWLREKGYHIVIFTDSPRYEVKIQDLNDGSFNVSGITHTYDTYEEAVEAAIKYSLENLI